MEFTELHMQQLKDHTCSAVAAAKEETKKWYEELKAAGADSVETKERVDKMMKRLDAIEAEASRYGNAFRDIVEQEKSVSDILLTDESVKRLAENRQFKGAAGVKIKSFLEFADFRPGVKTTITSAAIGSSTPGILRPERAPGIVKPGVRRIRVRDLIPRLQTQNNAVEFVKENTYTNAASPTAETISKPESELTFTIVSKTVKTIAHWLPMAKQALADFAELGGYVNMRLLEGLKDVEDNELVSGDGTGQHLEGLMTQAGAYDTARTGSADTIIDIINHAISQIEDAELAASGVILHPRDWRAMQVMKDTQGRYILGGPQMTLDANLWGLPVSTTTAVPPGSFLVGAFATHSALYDRMESQIALSTEHADYFIRNMVAALAEERITLVVTRNDAVLTGAFPSDAYSS